MFRFSHFTHFALLLLGLNVLVSVAPAQTFVVSGTVRDKSSGESLVAANIRIDGTARGTISNAEGAYRLSLPPGSYSLIVSFIGYKSDTVRVALMRDTMHDVALVPIAVQLAEIVVTDEDPAVRIMRNVIENKGQWKERLKSYQFDAFTRQILRRDTAIASITESYTTGYWQQGDTLREVVKQKRQTENVPLGQNFASVGGIVNFYDDEIRFSGFTFVGPTSPEAFEYYRFTLEGTRMQDSVELYSIRMTPRTKLTPLFSGTINIIGDSYSVVGIEVKPNEAYRIPFVTELNITYAQQFARYEEFFWMPVDIRLNGNAEIGIAGFSFPVIGFDQVSTIYEYRINAEVPDTLRQKPRRMNAPGAEKFDSTFWAEREVLPLTTEEQTAYKTLDSTQTLEKQFEPSGPLMALNTVSEGFLKYLDLHFNRVEGLFLGGEVTVDSIAPWMKLSAKAGYGLSDKRWKYGAEAEFFLDEKRNYSLGLGGSKDLGHFPDEGFYDTFFITLSSLLSKIDQRDYFYTFGWKFFVGAKPFRRLSLKATYRSEEHKTAHKMTEFSLLDRSKEYRPNAMAAKGMLRSVALNIRYGDSPVPLGLVSTNYIDIEIERSQPSLLAGDFFFSRVWVTGEFFVPTFLKRNLFPPTLLGRLSAGYSTGHLPPQRIFTLESRSDGFGPFGVLKGASLKEFAGERYFVLSLEHNFRSIPFLVLDVPCLYKNSLELILYGSVAKSWNPSGSLPYGRSTEGWYAETGIGMSRIFGLLRIDVTRRLTDSDAWFVTLGIARIF